jgi:hypothetical protein
VEVRLEALTVVLSVPSQKVPLCFVMRRIYSIEVEVVLSMVLGWAPLSGLSKKCPRGWPIHHVVNRIPIQRQKAMIGDRRNLFGDKADIYFTVWILLGMFSMTRRDLL